MIRFGVTLKKKFCALVQPILILQNTKVNNMCASDDFTCPVNAQIRMLFLIEFPYCMTNGNRSYNYKI